MAPSPEPPTIRMDARLDSMTRAKVDDLAQHFGRPLAEVLCHIMQWDLSHIQTCPLDQGDAQGPMRHLHLHIASDLHEGIEKAATAVGMKIAPWLRHMVRQMTMADVPTSWQGIRSEKRSHDSRTYGRRFILRLDEPSQTKLQQLINHFGASKAEIIRQLIAQAASEDFPSSWHMRAAERHAQQVLQQGTGNDQEFML